jgi:thiol-disulfide isomerase/thioredoxin
MAALHALLLTLTLGSGETVLLDFYGDACPPCREMAPVVDHLIAKRYPIRKVNVDREPALAQRYRVTGIPCFVMLVDGREVDRVTGATTSQRLQQMCARALPPPPLERGSSVQLVANEQPNPAAVAIPAVESNRTFATSSPDRGPVASDRGVVPAAFEKSAASPPPAWQLTSPDWTATADAQQRIMAELVAATVRLRIQDPDGQSCGSGTIIDARQGRALVLTCGHLFRDSQGRGQIEVDLFWPDAAEKVPGRLVHYDLDRDLALLSIPLSGAMKVAHVAPARFSIAKGARVVNVGCNNGDVPTPRESRVTSIDRFQGHPNIEASGEPVQGRSGGGLFSSEGYLIGVCNAAVPTDNEGLYAGLASVQAFIDQVKLPFVYRETNAPITLVGTPGPPSMPRQMPPPSDVLQLTGVPQKRPAVSASPLSALNTPASNRSAASAASSPVSGVVSDEEKAAMQEIQRRQRDGAEAIVILRSRTNPNAPSEIIVLDQVSPGFIKQISSTTASGSSSLESKGHDLPADAGAMGSGRRDVAGNSPSRADRLPASPGFGPGAGEAANGTRARTPSAEFPPLNPSER